MGNTSRPDETRTSGRRQRFRALLHARRGDSAAFATAPTSGPSVFGPLDARRNTAPVRIERVDAVRRKISADGYDLDASFRTAVSVLIRREL